MLLRKHYLDRIDAEFKVHPVVGVVGPRQVGKTTLADEYKARYPGQSIHFDMENELHLAQLQNPTLALQDFVGLIIIDEIQLLPKLFSYIRYTVDTD